MNCILLHLGNTRTLSRHRNSTSLRPKPLNSHRPKPLPRNDHPFSPHPRNIDRLEEEEMRTWTLTRPLLFRFDPLLPSEVPSLLVVSLVAKRHRTLYDVRNPLARSIKSILQVPKTTISISSVLAKRRNYLPLFLIQFNPRRQTLPVSLVRELRAVRHRLLTRRRQIDLSSYEALLRKKLSPPILHPLPRQVAVLASNLLQLLCSVLRVELSRFPRLSHRFLPSPVPSLILHQRLSWLLRLNLSR